MITQMSQSVGVAPLSLSNSFCVDPSMWGRIFQVREAQIYELTSFQTVRLVEGPHQHLIPTYCLTRQYLLGQRNVLPCASSYFLGVILHLEGQAIITSLLPSS